MTSKTSKVLLIEDDQADAQLIMEILREEPENAMEILHVSNLAHGLETLERGGIDVVLLDLTLPDSSGHNTFAMLAKHVPTMPVIVLTGMDDKEMAIRIVQEGAQDYLVKSLVDYTMLARSIRYSIERKRTLLEKDQLIGQLRETLADVKMLSGLLPICASCKHIRDDKGYWHQVESYIQQHSSAVFTHGLCPKCSQKIYPKAAAGNDIPG
ncbi:MAG: response regulator [Verrucomicrobia bacterium]|nr:response regulator [Verrucomicrobiota bacterium]MBU1736251.1 response regulator [Verrucomicrobiota bacterium]MBU1856967.1 response regulator [Verrucomicrobiota bacterium]